MKGVRPGLVIFRHNKSLAFLLVLFVLAGCRRRETPIAAPVAKSSFPASVSVIVDTSASMQGYFNGDTQLKDSLAQIASSLDQLQTREQGLRRLSYELVGDRGALDPTNYDTRTFIEKLRSGQLMRRRDSLLQDAFSQIIKTSGENTAAILVSDSIISYPDADIRANPRINIDNLGSLRAEVQTVFAEARAHNLSASVFALRSAFHGTYYDYRNQPSPCCSGPRPYYVWIIGPPSLVRSVGDYLQGEGLHAEHEIIFSVPITTPPAAVLQRLDAVGRFYRGRASKTSIEVKSAPNGKPIQFAVAVDLSSLPSYMKDPAFLTEHLHVSSPGTLVNVKLRKDVEKLANNDAPAVLPGYTHVVEISLEPNLVSSGRLDISLDAALPSWYLAWSNKDDAHGADGAAGTTFGLSYLVEGVAGAYRSPQPAAQLSIDVRK